MVKVAGEREPVEGQGPDVIEQGAQAVRGLVVRGDAGGGLPPGDGEDVGRLQGRGAPGADRSGPDPDRTDFA